MYVLTNGSLVTVINGQRIVYAIGSFCVDGAVGQRNHSHGANATHAAHFQPEQSGSSGSEIDQLAVICYPDIKEANKYEYFVRTKVNIDIS
jgi:hypothetical protein